MNSKRYFQMTLNECKVVIEKMLEQTRIEFFFNFYSLCLHCTFKICTSLIKYSSIMFENEEQLFMLDTLILTRGKSFTLSDSNYKLIQRFLQ